ncbi:MAG: nickel-dependent lactate racemase [Armatimonadaceae bacterium]
MQIHLSYGKNGLDVEVPEGNLRGVLTYAPADPMADPVQAVRDGLANPIGTRPLAEAAQGKRNACIVVCDITRPVPNAVLLPPILEALEEGGISREQVTVLIATGTHRPNEGAELDTILGAELAQSLRVVNHVCTDRESHRHFGESPNGVPVYLDKTYTEADVRITVGLIEPHFMAGYSGGRKLIMPGIAALETIQAWHSPRFLEHPNATNGITDGNPVHEENTAIASLCPPDLIVDCTLDEEKRITGVFVGEMVAAWREGVRFAAGCVRATIPEPVDIVVTSSAGFPLDATFYQTVKGMVGALPIVKPGGSIIIASECSEGIGGPHFQKLLFDTEDLGELMVAMQSDGWEYVPDQWQVEELAKATRRNRVYLVSSGIPAATAALLFVTPMPTVEAALTDALTRHGNDATIAVIPKGPYVIAAVAPE